VLMLPPSSPSTTSRVTTLFYTLLYVMVVVMVLHVLLLHIVGSTSPLVVDARDATLPFYTAVGSWSCMIAGVGSYRDTP